MRTSEAHPEPHPSYKEKSGRFPKALSLTGAVLGSLAGFLLALWATLAIYYSNLPWHWARLSLAFLFALFSIYALWLARSRRMRAVFAGLFIAVVVWEMLIAPSNNRSWRPEVAVMPRATIDGNRVFLTGVRDFKYRSVNDFTPHYVEREVSLDYLTSIDYFISYWAEGPVAHTFLSFNFDNAPPVSISIETRPEVGEGFSPIASLFKQFELIYVVGDERDIVRVRTNYRDEDVYMYHIQTTPAAARRLFLIYMDRINQLADRPEWYHLLKNNCTLNIFRYARAAGREQGFNIRHLINGWSDRYLYQARLIDHSMPFDTLRVRSRITDIARAADDTTSFSRRIRAVLPGDPEGGNVRAPGTAPQE